MQFKHPEILWFHLLLLIPIIVHFFQLRRFKKTLFTNVAMLEKVRSESRKSHSIKKWLLLFTRLLLLACIVLAFAQPFFAKVNALKEKETVIYIDDSFSMRAKKDGISLLEKAVQDFVQTAPPNTKFSLFTNQKTFAQVDINQVQNELISLGAQSKQLSFQNVLRKANTLFSNSDGVLKELIVISDFQKRLGNITNDSLNPIDIHAVNLNPDSNQNVSIDSVFLDAELNLNVRYSGLQGESVPLALYNDTQLIGKTALDSNSDSTIVLTIPTNEEIRGRLEITDNSLEYDNVFYFNIDEKPTIKVLAITETDFNFLSRIFTDDEFEFVNTSPKNLNYSSISKQNLIVLNELKEIPNSLQTALISFLDDGGSLTMIPPNQMNGDSYSSLLSGLIGVGIQEKVTSEKRVTNIAFENPLFADVFERRVTNFDYPSFAQYYRISGNFSNALSFESGEAFLLEKQRVYLFTAPLNKENGDFQDSPLIVPSFYKMGLNSLNLPKTHFTIEQKNEVEVPTVLVKEDLVKLVKEGMELIPLQQSYPTKVGLSFENNPEEAGIYAVIKGIDTIQHLSFNHEREESNLEFLELDNTMFASINSEIPSLFDELAEERTIDAYWKWFVIFALIFALVEVLIQKFLA